MLEKRTAVEQVMKQWKTHRNALLELVAALPESAGSWRPWEGGKSTIELVYHLAVAPEFFFASIEASDINIPPVPPTLSGARDLLERLTEEHQQKLASFSDSDLQRYTTIQLLKITEPVEDVLYRLIEHEAHHKGQLMVYARVKGVEPPFFVDLSV